MSQKVDLLLYYAELQGGPQDGISFYLPVPLPRFLMAGLVYDKTQCDGHDQVSCVDHLRFAGSTNSVEEWEIQFPNSTHAVTKPGFDYNEARLYGGNQNMGYFEKAKQAIISGSVLLTVEPTGETYKVQAVKVRVEFMTNEQRGKNHS
jgi:hypothetical protein